MSGDPAGFRPKRYPASEFPPRRTRLFARTPPVIFTPILGLCALQPALLSLLDGEGLRPDAASFLGGILVPFWIFALLAMAVKIARRPSVIPEDLRVIPSRNGLFAASLSGMVIAGILLPVWPGAAYGVLGISLAMHLVLLILFLRQILGPGGAGPSVDPGWHLAFAGPLVAAFFFANTGFYQLSQILFYSCGAASALIFLAGLWGMISSRPPAPLRPMLAIHLAPVSLMALTATALGQERAGLILTAIALILFVVLVMSVTWLTASGFSPIWGSFTFPLAVFAQTVIVQGGVVTGGLILALASLSVAVIAWRILRLWPGGKLAAMTNAAEA